MANKRAGFEVEGLKRNALRVDGAYVNEIYMAKFISEETGISSPREPYESSAS